MSPQFFSERGRKSSLQKSDSENKFTRSDSWWGRVGEKKGANSSAWLRPRPSHRERMAQPGHTEFTETALICGLAVLGRKGLKCQPMLWLMLSLSRM